MTDPLLGYLLWVPPLVLGLLLHECAHGLVALWLGDTTARDCGRLSLNPLRHIDPVGTLLVPAVALLLGGVPFMWLKPVPIDVTRLRHPRRDMALIAAAGPGANTLQALAWFALAWGVASTFGRLGAAAPEMGLGLVLALAWGGILVNCVVAMVNLLPVPPLDGSRIAILLLPRPWRRAYEQAWPAGLILLLVFFNSGGFEALLAPLLEEGQSWLMAFLAAQAE
jgi:Zn-dependent protease